MYGTLSPAFVVTTSQQLSEVGVTKPHWMLSDLSKIAQLVNSRARFRAWVLHPPYLLQVVEKAIELQRL